MAAFQANCGAVAEWSKALAWKVSIRQNRIEGSNPSRSASLGELRNQGTCVVADHRLRRCVGVEDAVPALRFVRRIADVAGVAPHEMVIGMLCPPFAAPAPEVAPLQRPAGADAVKHGAGDQSVEAVLQGRGGAGIEAPAIAGEAEFLDNERL